MDGCISIRGVFSSFIALGSPCRSIRIVKFYVELYL